MPHPTELARIAVVGLTSRSSTLSTPAMISVSRTGEKTTSSAKTAGPLALKLGPATCGSSALTTTDSARLGNKASGQPTRIAASALRGTRTGFGR
jgi:hypothetical protein